jgi:hypothetical protein
VVEGGGSTRGIRALSACCTWVQHAFLESTGATGWQLSMLLFYNCHRSLDFGAIGTGAMGTLEWSDVVFSLLGRVSLRCCCFAYRLADLVLCGGACSVAQEHAVAVHPNILLPSTLLRRTQTVAACHRRPPVDLCV